MVGDMYEGWETLLSPQFLHVRFHDSVVVPEVLGEKLLISCDESPRYLCVR